MSFFDGLKQIGQGVLQVFIGVGKAVFAFLKFMLFAAVCVVVGIYSALKGIRDFVKKAYQKLKEKRRNVKIKSAGSATEKVLIKVLNGIDKEVAAGTLKLSDLEKEEVLDDVKNIKQKISKGEANGMRWIEGENERGEEEIFDADLIKYEQLSEDDERRNKTEKAFIQNIA